MRYDPVDLADAQFILDRSGLTRKDIRALRKIARVPDIAEIQEQFALCVKNFL
jgi:hypothetical protein